MPEVRILSAADIERLLPMPAAIAAVAEAYKELSAGRVQMPVRLQVPVPEHGGRSLFMPVHAPAFGMTAVKAVSVYPGNRDRGLPAILGAVLALDDATGAPLALMDAASLTAIRTGAATGVACRHLARPDSAVAALFGAGGMAGTQVRAVLAALPVREVRIVSRGGGTAAALAARLAAQGLRAAGGEPVRFAAVTGPDAPSRAASGADVVIACTPSHTPVFPAGAVAPGALICGVGGFTPEMQEVPAAALARCARLYVDSREAARHEAGDLVQAVAAGALAWDRLTGEIGELLLGRIPGRGSADEIIYFKTCGLAVQDLAAAAAVLRAAAGGAGTTAAL